MGIFTAKKTNDSENQEKEVIDLNKEKKVKEEMVKEEKSMKDLYNEGDKKTSKKGVKNSVAYRVLVKPLITEKAANLASLNQYAFVVSASANKIDVAKAVFEVYGVKPEKVNIIKVKGKVVNRGRVTGKRKDFKKALVSLKKGDSISIYEGV
jgi:large subunit ribosomal protein L23